jgi:hypothetical protein
MLLEAEHILNVALGLVLGLAGGLGLAFLFENLDDALFDRENRAVGGIAGAWDDPGEEEVVRHI